MARRHFRGNPHPGPTLRAASALLALLATSALPKPGHADHDAVPSPPPRSTAERLQPLPKPDPTGITVSGLSSGGFFAHQFHVAHSDVVSGAAIMAGGPYGCVETIPNPYWPLLRVPLDRFSAATLGCTHYYGSRYLGLPVAGPEAEDSIDLIRDAWARRAIDDPANLADDRVWLFHGEHDLVVPRRTMETLKEVYRGLGLGEPDLHADWEHQGRAAEHGIPVHEFTGESRFDVPDCDEHAPPFIIECGYEASELLLRHLHPEDFGAAPGDPHGDGTLIAFDQTEFLESGDRTAGLHPVGYAYVPATCAERSCRLHIAFHGCRQGVESVHDDFVRDAGYNRWAATHGIVVLYPQAAASPVNPNGCWDFWGYTGADYATKEGPQMRAVRAMADRLLGT